MPNKTLREVGVAMAAKKANTEPTTKEELAYPKEHCCLTDEFNLELAQCFPAESAAETSPSFGALAANVRACSDLLAALNAM